MLLTTRMATEADLEALTALHLASFSPAEHLGVRLGSRFVWASYRWHVADDASYVIVAESDGRLIGLLGMCDGPFTVRMMRGCAGALFGAFIRRPALLLDRGMWSRLTRSERGGDWAVRFCSAPKVAVLTIVAVDARARGQGVFSSLIRHCEALSRHRGMAAVRVGVYRSNVASRRAFAKCGWVETPALGSSETVCYVRVIDPGLMSSFPQLGGLEAHIPGA